MDKNIKINNNDKKLGDMNSFWISGPFNSTEDLPYFSLGINGRSTSVSGRYDQSFNVDEAKEIVKFLSEKIAEIETP